MALAHLLEKRGKEDEAREVRSILPETQKGHSVESLLQIAARFGFEPAALKLSANEIHLLSLPAIVHVSIEPGAGRGHYLIVDKADKDSLELIDPQSKARFHKTNKELEKEWSGIALVFSDGGDLPGARLSKVEMEPVFGGCCGVPSPPGGLGCGSPKWWVNKVNMNLFVNDTPLWYKSPFGPSVEISLSYNSQASIASVVHNLPELSVQIDTP